MRACSRCARPADTEGRTCSRCRAKDSTRKASRKAKGLCAHCAKPVDTEGMTCSRCRASDAVGGAKRKTARKSKGQCVGCGSALDSDATKCSRCRASAAALRARIKARGQCVNCTEPAKAGATKCGGCQDEFNASAKEGYHWLQSLEICPRCEGPSDKAKGLCTTCTKAARKTAHRRKAPQRKLGWAQATYHARKAEGMCTKCGGQRAAGCTTVQCAPCLTKTAEHNRTSRGNKNG